VVLKAHGASCLLGRCSTTWATHSAQGCPNLEGLFSQSSKENCYLGWCVMFMGSALLVGSNRRSINCSGLGTVFFFFKCLTSLFYFIFFLLFICAYKAWVISPPCPHPFPYHPVREGTILKSVGPTFWTPLSALLGVRKDINVRHTLVCRGR
jgi:hypothetical protein